jgi:hypothetical protein
MGMQEQSSSNGTARRCRLLTPIRDRSGRVHFGELPIILRELVNLDREMLLVQFGDGSTTFVFSEEVSKMSIEPTCSTEE